MFIRYNWGYSLAPNRHETYFTDDICVTNTQCVKIHLGIFHNLSRRIGSNPFPSITIYSLGFPESPRHLGISWPPLLCHQQPPQGALKVIDSTLCVYPHGIPSWCDYVWSPKFTTEYFWGLDASIVFVPSISGTDTWNKHNGCIKASKNTWPLETSNSLTHWGWYKMTRVSNQYSWMKMIGFWFKFHLNLLPMDKLTISQHWFR